ncbi:EpsG family protein [uncultured Bacteroides sp.]|uniref:EpsG family protein n=1 Tax=uncultured Bacteroides sp. TaxID=162156 RepID=UPI002589AA3B|nr:EpsG family protein [uncultured Bacteroides sp.]
MLTNNHLIYCTLQTFMYILLCIGGIKISRINNNRSSFWIASILPILAFGLNYGLRWGRGVDYNLYFWVYNNLLKGIAIEGSEPLWNILVRISGNVFHLPWQGMVMFMSFFLMFSCTFFIQNHKNVAFYALPLLALYIFESQNLMRWFLASSFFLIGVKFLENGAWKKYLVFACLAFFTHSGSITVLLPTFLLYFCKKPILPTYVSLSIFFISYFLFDPRSLGVFSDFLQNINIGTRFVAYQNNAEAWLVSENLEMSGISMIDTINSIFIIICGKSLLKRRPNLLFIYNLALFGTITKPSMAQIEIAWRINLIFFMFQAIILSYLFYDYINRHIKTKPIFYVIILLILILNIRYAIVQPLNVEQNSTYYIWDSKGRNIL